MEILQLLLVIASVAGFLYFFVMRLEKDIGKLETNIGKLSDKLDRITDKLDSDFKHLTAIQSEQSKRIDTLNERLDDSYKIIISMLEKGNGKGEIL